MHTQFFCFFDYFFSSANIFTSFLSSGHEEKYISSDGLNLSISQFMKTENIVNLFQTVCITHLIQDSSLLFE